MNLSAMEYFDILYKAYNLKIEARNKHHDNFHKWMTFYSVAIGAILVAFYQLRNEIFLSFFLIIFGITTSYLWHISCKGYRHWADHWIREIWKTELEIESELKKKNYNFNSINQIMVYTTQPPFTKVQFNPLKSAIISTPKVTLIFSYLVFWGWLVILFWKIQSILPLTNICLCLYIFYLFILFLGIVCIYFLFFHFVSNFLYSGTYKETKNTK